MLCSELAHEECFTHLTSARNKKRPLCSSAVPLLEPIHGFSLEHAFSNQRRHLEFVNLLIEARRFLQQQT